MLTPDISHEDLVEMVASLSAQVSLLERKFMSMQVPTPTNYWKMLGVPKDIDLFGVCVTTFIEAGTTEIGVKYGDPNYYFDRDHLYPYDTSFTVDRIISQSEVFNSVERGSGFLFISGGGNTSPSNGLLKYSQIFGRDVGVHEKQRKINTKYWSNRRPQYIPIP